ncbi:hypothetical protein COBT_002826 [Conglomerata obtusa]
MEEADKKDSFWHDRFECSPCCDENIIYKPSGNDTQHIYKTGTNMAKDKPTNTKNYATKDKEKFLNIVKYLQTKKKVNYDDKDKRDKPLSNVLGSQCMKRKIYHSN